MKFNEKIVRLRKIKGITQDELASAVGVSRQAVYKWECGQSYPEVAKLIELKLLFNISIDDLLDDSYEIQLPEKKKKKRQPKLQQKAYTVEKKEEEVAAPAIETEENREEPVLVSAALEKETVAEAKAEEPAAAVEAPVVTETVKDSSEPIEEKAAEPEKQAEDNKKSGFFGRLFGRK